MVKVVATSMRQAPPLLGAIVVVVVVIDPPLFSTQFGNGVHKPLLRHVTFRLPPLFIKPAPHDTTMYESTKTVVPSCEAAVSFF